MAKSLIHRHLLECPVPEEENAVVDGGEAVVGGMEEGVEEGVVVEEVVVEGVMMEDVLVVGGGEEAMMVEQEVVVEGGRMEGGVVEGVVVEEGVWNGDVVQQCNLLMRELAGEDRNSGAFDLNSGDVSAEFDVSEDEEDEDWIDNM